MGNDDVRGWQDIKLLGVQGAISLALHGAGWNWNRVIGRFRAALCFLGGGMDAS